MSATPRPQPVEALSIESSPLPEGILLTLRGELDLASVPVIEGELDRAAQSHRLIVIDLRPLSFIDSTGLHMLIRANQSAREQGRRLVLVRPQGQVQRVLELTHVGQQLEFIADPLQLGE